MAQVPRPPAAEVARTLLLAALVAVSGCGSDPSDPDRPGAAAAVDPGPSSSATTSSPFSVRAVPEGYEVVTAGAGTDTPVWGDDEVGTDEPFTVLSPDGTATGEGVVVVATTGFEGYQQGLAQAAVAASDRRETFTVDGRPAIFTPASEGGRGPLTPHWADLVVDHGGDVAVRVTAPDAERADLVAVAERTEVVGDGRQAPAVPDPPDGLEVVGSVGVDAVLAGRNRLERGRDDVPGPATAHGAGWAAGAAAGGEHLTVLALPGGSVDLDALPALGRSGPPVRTWAWREAAGRPALVSEPVPGGWPDRSVWLRTSWDDVVVVTAAARSALDADDLLAVAASVRQADADEWDAFVDEAFGGPGLNPDRGAFELSRGVVGEIEWLLQAADGHPGTAPESRTTGPVGVDPCLKLSTGRRACADWGGNGSDDWFRWSRGDEGMPPFVLVSTTLPGTGLHVVSAAGDTTVPLATVPDTAIRTAVTFVDPSLVSCLHPPGVPLPGQPTPVRIEIVDAGGTAIRCLGLGGT